MINPVDLELKLQRHQSNKVHPSLLRFNYPEASLGASRLISELNEPKEVDRHQANLYESILISRRSPRNKLKDSLQQKKIISNSELQLNIPKLIGFFKYNEIAPTVNSNRIREKKVSFKRHRQPKNDKLLHPKKSDQDNKGKENTNYRLSIQYKGSIDKKKLNSRRSDVNLQELHQRLSEYQMSKAVSQSTKNTSRTQLPEISNSTLRLRRSESRPQIRTNPNRLGDETQRNDSQESRHQEHLNSRRILPFNEEIIKGPWIYVNGRQPELVITRRKIEESPKSNGNQFVLYPGLTRKENTSTHAKEKIFLYSFLEKDVPIPIPHSQDISQLKQRIDQNFETNLKSLQKYGSKICLRAKANIDKIMETNKLAQQSYRVELLLKIKDFLLFFKTLKLAPKIILKFPIRPYQNPRAPEFIEAAKFGDIERIKELLYRVTDLLIFEFDHLHLTALHWATKRNHVRCAEDLISMKSYVNARDVYGRIPLYYAIKNKAETLVYKMLVYKASPWSTKGCNYIELAEGDENIIYYIRRFRFMELILSFHKIHERESVRRQFIEKKIRVPKFAHVDLDQVYK